MEKLSDGFWHCFINEREAARFLGVSDRQMQNWRYRGGGPQYVKLSPRCIRYCRRDLKVWAEDLHRSSTSDQFSLAA